LHYYEPVTHNVIGWNRYLYNTSLTSLTPNVGGRILNTYGNIGEAGVDVIEVPTSSTMTGRTNVYLISSGTEGVLVDTGLFSISTIHSLISKMKKAGYSLCRLSYIIVTHYHPSHASLVPTLVEASEAEVFMGRRDARIISLGATSTINRALASYPKHGMPVDELREAERRHPLMKLAEVYIRLFRGIDLRPLNGGDVIYVGPEKLRVYPTPGHTPGSIILVHEDTRTAFVGDTLLEGPGPSIISYEEGGDPLGDYLKSLELISSLELRRAFPGHGPPVDEPSRKAKELIEEYRRELNHILDAVDEAPRTAYSLAGSLAGSKWADMPAMGKFVSLGRVLAYLRHLKERGLVDYYEERGLIYWYRR